MTNPIADILTRLHNANSAFHESVSVLYSGLKIYIAEILERGSYIAGFSVEEAKVSKTLTPNLKYGSNRERTLAGLRHIPKPGLCVYAKSTSLPKVPGDLGVAILSTSPGLLTDRETKDKGVSREVLAYVW